MAPDSRKSAPQTPAPGVAFLLSQVGSHVAGCFAEKIAPLGLKPYHAGILSILTNQPGLTQQGLADLLGIFPSRLVALLDDLSKQKLIERRATPSDRRTYSLHLTEAGHNMWAKMGELAEQMQEEVCGALTTKERETLTDLLTRIVTQQQITPGVHPGFRKLDGGCGQEEASDRPAV
jgi:DNA-binding MarR family transcriptional regulator